MHRYPTCLLASLLSIAALSACQRSVPASAASAPAGASEAHRESGIAGDDRPESLMRAAFGSWDAQHPAQMEVPAHDPKGSAIAVDVAPLMVVAPDDTHRVLLLGPPPADNGEALGGHASPGNLGGIWYTRQGTRWIESGRQPSILSTGFFGSLGTLEPIDLGPRHHAVSVQNGSCWQGYCGEWLSVVEFGPDKAQTVLALQTGSSSMGASEGCPVASAPSATAPGESASDAASAPLSAAASEPEDAKPRLDVDKCMDISSTWRVQARESAERGDLVVKFVGTELVQAGKDQSLTPHAVDETLVLREVGGVYERVTGRNPTRGF